MIRVGPAGWAYTDWEGILYPAPKPRAFRPLVLIARLFDLAEVNATFYAPPKPETAETWCDQLDEIVAERFRFTVKLWQGLTHEPLPPKGETERLRALLETLQRRGRLLAALAQFPWSFKNTAANRARLRELAGAWSEPWPLAVEVRHGSWDSEEFRDWLREHGLPLVNIDQPVIGESLPPAAHLTSPRLAYVRLHGRNQKAWFAENTAAAERYNYLYQAEELAPWAVRIGHLGAEARETVVVTNNHFRAQAVINGLELQSAVDPQREVPVPPALVEHYPELRSVPGLRLATPEELDTSPPPAKGEGTGQLEMF